MPKHIIFGYPGTGKTTKLINILEQLFNEGISPNKVCFCTFTRSGADEIKERIGKKFNLSKKEIDYFSTFHSICYKHFCIEKKVINNFHIEEFFDKIKVEYQFVHRDEDLITNELDVLEDGNALMNFYDNLRIQNCKDINDITEENLKAEFHTLKNLNSEIYSQIFANSFNPYKILKKFEKYKEENGLIDYIDMLLFAYKTKWIIPTDILIVDEFQDLSKLQYEIYKIWAQDKKEVYLAGDDDQTIYSFICADSKFLLNEKDSILKENGDSVEILKQTYRLSSVIHEYCLKYINKNIDGANRVEKNVVAIKDGGELIHEDIDGNLEKILEFIEKEVSTFILFRTNYQKRQFISEVLLPAGLFYEEIKGIGLWNVRTINLYNAVVNLVNKKPLYYIEVKYLIDSIPAKFKLMKRGLKSKFNDMQPEERYNLSDLLRIGFDIELFSYLTYNKLFNILKLNNNIRTAFQNSPRRILKYPIPLKVGTIHSSKGKEAETVIIFKDISKKISKNIQKNKESWENEIRVFHVGQTRAMNKLIIIRGGFEFAESHIIP